MTKHHGRRAAHPLATGVMGPTTTTTRRILIPMKLEPSSLFAGATWPIDVGEKSPFEKCRPNVKIETTPDERRVLHDAHVALIALRRTFDHWVTVGRGLQLLRKKADQIGTRNAFNDLRDQHRLGDKHFRKEAVSRRAVGVAGTARPWRGRSQDRPPDAYGHSRLGEWMFGGMTRDLLATGSICCLMRIDGHFEHGYCKRHSKSIFGVWPGRPDSRCHQRGQA